MVQILEVTSSQHLQHVRELMRALVAWLLERHSDQIEMIHRYFDADAFEAELRSLPGKYGPPGGRLLLALHDDEVAGCVALQDLGGNACEMKRMFVSPKFHGLGVGVALASAIIKEAEKMGYDEMKLDTGPEQSEAQGLYKRLGFQAVQPYYDLPQDMREWLVFMRLDLHQ
jgi:GNAT superfamily N-acetyltransferase